MSNETTLQPNAAKRQNLRPSETYERRPTAVTGSVLDTASDTNWPSAPLRTVTGQNPPDEFDHQMKRHRADLQLLENQIAELDIAIDQDQKLLNDLRAALDAKYHTRKRLMHVREATVTFVQLLQSAETE